MGNAGAKAQPSLGFLTVVDNPTLGLFGGYLVLTTTGRPLEFHCTAPVKANRAQEILYGPTLQSYLYGDQIGRTLLDKATTKATIVLTDHGPMLAVRPHIKPPAALVLPSDPDDDRQIRIDQAHTDGPSLVTFKLGRRSLAVSGQHADDRELITQCIAPLAEHFDLSEPFERIRSAIEEAQQ